MPSASREHVEGSGTTVPFTTKDGVDPYVFWPRTHGAHRLPLPVPAQAHPKLDEVSAQPTSITRSGSATIQYVVSAASVSPAPVKV